MRRTFPLVSTALLLAACGGSIPAPSERLAQAEAASRGAQELGAASEPSAALHLKEASDQITRAKQLMDAGDNKPAEALLIRAQADAELAVLIAKAAKARTEADEAIAHQKAAGGGK